MIIKVVCCYLEKIRTKLICKGGNTIKSIEVIAPEKPPPPPPPVPRYLAFIYPIGVCCKSCYEGCGGGSCHHGYGIPHHHHLIRICKASAIIWSQPGRCSFDEGMKLLKVKYMAKKNEKVRGRKLIESN